MSVPKDIEVEIYFLTTEEGGRSTPAFTGYRPQFYYDEKDWDASHIYPDVEIVKPGETVRAYLGFASPQEHLGRVYKGMEFLIREGPLTVGRGKVINIVDLVISAKNSSG